ncbi:MAG TPA: polymer-forming cytoskeletal protein [Rhizomicrobium sp.]|nr:polymer-forming cytoskeletal protein [Rhizomicrobium sp.]
MFSSKSKDAPPPPATPVSPAPAKRARALSAPSIISADMAISGSLRSTGDIQIDGRMEGDVHSIGLVIGDKAEIHGEVFAEEVTVRGKVVGRIRARKVLLATTSHVEGDILHEALAIETGAFFEGNCRHSDNPLDNPLDNSLGDPAPGSRANGESRHSNATQSQAAAFAPLNPAAT